MTETKLMWFDEICGKEIAVVDIPAIKLKCFEFATKITDSGIYKPYEVMDEAKKIFDWITDNEPFKTQY